MSITGTLAFFVEERPSDMGKVIRGLFEVAQIQSVGGSISVSGLGDVFVKVRDGRPCFDHRAIDRGHPSKWMGTGKSLEQLILATHGHAWVLASVYSPRGTTLSDAIRRDIPLEISGGASTTQFHFIFGPHDWAEEEPTDPPGCIYYGRSQVAVSLFGYGSPRNPPLYREMIFKIPEFVELQREIEGVLGPVKRCISWSF